MKRFDCLKVLAELAGDALVVSSAGAMTFLCCRLPAGTPFADLPG